MKTTLQLLIFLFLSFSNFVHAQTEAEYQTQLEKDFERSFDDVKSKAEAGDINSQRVLGIYYQMGYKTNENITEAKKWFTKAAEKGDGMSQYYLGSLYQKMGNVSGALEWYLKSAHNGNGMGALGVGFLYQNGFGEKASTENVIKYFEMAFKNG